MTVQVCWLDDLAKAQEAAKRTNKPTYRPPYRFPIPWHYRMRTPIRLLRKEAVVSQP
ncbi:MAG: hypothetical protein P8X65_03500 [Syntrophobacterales bacterium]